MLQNNAFWASCRQSCQPGDVNLNDPWEHRTPWSCELIDTSHPDCTEDGEDCIHLGCCKSKGHRCFMKDPGEAFCRTSSPPMWLGHEIMPNTYMVMHRIQRVRPDLMLGAKLTTKICRRIGGEACTARIIGIAMVRVAMLRTCPPGTKASMSHHPSMHPWTLRSLVEVSTGKKSG